jgi:hypothetical protein
MPEEIKFEGGYYVCKTKCPYGIGVSVRSYYCMEKCEYYISHNETDEKNKILLCSYLDKNEKREAEYAGKT